MTGNRTNKNPMAIKLSLPTVADSADAGIEIRPVYIEEWVENLAYATPARLLEQTLTNVSALNQQPLKAPHRLKVLDLHIKPYTFALAFRRNQEAAQTSTVLQRQRNVSKGMRLLSTELALGYKQVLADLMGKKSNFGSSRDMRTALQRASLFCSLSLLHCYDEYRPAHKNIWREVIALYKYSEKLELHMAPAPIPGVADKGFDDCTATLFKRLCLTSLVDPYHLAYGELWRVYEAFGDYAPAAEIIRITDVQRPAGIFVIDPNLDQSPIAFAQLTSPPAAPSRLLYVNPVLKKLRDHRPAADTDTGLPSHVLAAMVRALGLPPKRHTPRESSEGRVVIAVGLSTVHHFLLNGAEPQAAAPANEDEIEIHASPGHNAPRRYSYRSEGWEVADEGPGGFGLVRDDPPDIPAGAGELVGLNFPQRGDDGFSWTIGVVRWVNIGSDNRQQMGIQVLDTSASPITLIVENVTDTITRIPRPALALPQLDATRGSTIISPRGIFAKGSQLRVGGDSRIALIEAHTLSESTSSFDRFNYKVMEQN